MYGRAQPLGQPVTRVVHDESSPSPTERATLRSRALISGITRSASVCARPHSGSAGHAIELRVRRSTSSMGLTPCSARRASILGLSAGSMSCSITFWPGVSSIVSPNWSTILRSAVLSRSSPRSMIRPCSTLIPTKYLPSPCSCQPSQSMPGTHGGSGSAASTGLPRYLPTSSRKPSMPRVCTRYFIRAFARTSRFPWSRCTAMIALHSSKTSSAGTKPSASAARAKVVSLLCVRPIPPPTYTLKPLSVAPSGSMMTTRPRSFVIRSIELSPGTVTPILNLRGR
mmetsp:Transcript_14085/g.36528  ORF Transcript_14085/g.36528 Transcript_14085/m.36528 type:complete len:284 (-) Transcript_14085:930-1781(-)